MSSHSRYDSYLRACTNCSRYWLSSESLQRNTTLAGSPTSKHRQRSNVGKTVRISLIIINNNNNNSEFIQRVYIKTSNLHLPWTMAVNGGKDATLRLKVATEHTMNG